MKHKFVGNLEILRGFAAAIVVIAHIIYHHSYFDRYYFPTVLKAFEPPAHFAVLIFFVLSGYVIGKSHKERLSGYGTLNYLKKRFVRIYPIYLIALTISVISAESHYGFMTILSNYTLTQNISYKPIWENNPIWSLNYEVLYYLLFIGISYFNIKSTTAIIGSGIIAGAGMYFSINSIICGYAIGFCFWCSGLYIARNFNNEFSLVKMIPLLIYTLSLEKLLIGYDKYLDQLYPILHLYNLAHGFWSQIIVRAYDLKYLPYCILLIMFVAGVNFKNRNLIFMLLQIFPLASIVISLKHAPLELNSFWVSACLYLFSGLIYFLNTRKLQAAITKFGIWLGSISYGLYIIHFPILMLIGRFSFGSPGSLSYAIKILCMLTLSPALAWMLEKKVQPVIKGLLTG